MVQRESPGAAMSLFDIHQLLPLGKRAGGAHPRARSGRPAFRLMPAAVGMLLPFLSGCATVTLGVCPAGQERMQAVELLFGRNTNHGGLVSEAEWKAFLAREITPRFPDGLTTFDAAGQWRDPARNVTVHEPSKVVLIVHRNDPQAQLRLSAIAEAYKRRFRQRSVGIVARPVCASF